MRWELWNRYNVIQYKIYHFTPSPPMSPLFSLIDDLFRLQTTRDHHLALYPYGAIQAQTTDQYHAEIFDDTQTVISSPYSSHYQRQLQHITDALDQFVDQEATHRWPDDQLRLYAFVSKRKDVCHSNDWLALEEERVRLSHGKGEYLLSLWPIENYSDPLWWGKRLFTAVLLRRETYLDDQATAIQSFVAQDAINQFPDCPPTPVTVWIGNIIDWAGEVKHVRASWRSRPEQAPIINRVWSIKQIFLDQTVSKALAEYLPLHDLAARHWWCTYEWASVKDFYQQYFWIGLLCHELGHTVGKHEDYTQRMGFSLRAMEENRAELLAIKRRYDLCDAWLVEKNMTWLFLWSNLLGAFSMWRGYQQTGERKAYRYHLWIFVRLWEWFMQWRDRAVMRALVASCLALAREGDAKDAAVWMDWLVVSSDDYLWMTKII